MTTPSPNPDDVTTRLREEDLQSMVDRLRGIYRIPITDGLGATGGGEEPDNPNEFVRTFETSPIMRQAADLIDLLRRQLAERDAALDPATIEACAKVIEGLTGYTGEGTEARNDGFGMFARGVRFAKRTLSKSIRALGEPQ